MAYLPIDLMTSELRNFRRLKVETEARKSAFGDQLVSQDTPLIQVTAQYGILDDIIVALLGGTATTENSNFIASTGTGTSNVAAIVSSKDAQYKAGQGLKCRITALFTEGVPDSNQQAGFITSESAFAFGYDGDRFGILYAKDGQLENQELTLSTGASSNETASVTIDGALYSVPLTSGTASHNAYEIATYLDANVNGYNFNSVGNVVYALASLPDFGSGGFDFSSATASGIWLEIQNGKIPDENWIYKEDWNVKPDIKIDPTKGNVYQIQIQYLGYGGIVFSIEDPETSKLEVVHVLHYASTAEVPSVSNPIFRVGWACRNTGNNSDIVVRGASGAAFVEGNVVFDGRPKALCASQSVGTSTTNILALRNRLTFNNTTNRADIISVLSSLSSDSDKTTFFEIIENPILNAGDSLNFVRFEDGSLMEYATDNVEIIGGDVVGCFTVRSAQSEDANIDKVLGSLPAGETFSIAARVSQGPDADMDVSFIWKEDL